MSVRSSNPAATATTGDEPGLGIMVKRALFWRSGSQILSQLLAWGSTLAVIRILDPADYGIFAMTQVVLAFLSFLNGYGFASALIREKEIGDGQIRQAFGMLIVINAGLALVQLCIAPLAAGYYRQPEVAELLRLQALIFLATPFIALPEVLLIRRMDFRRHAFVNLTATAISAAVALGSALAGYGVWTLVYAAIALFWTRGAGLMLAARFRYWPSFRFTGARWMFDFGLMVLGGQIFWTLMTQADTFIAARVVSPHELGLYAEALFLTTLIAAKFVPPLNDVAFPAYSRLQDDRTQLGAAFLKAVKLIMLVTCPLYFGMSAVAPDLIEVVLGEKWLPMAGLVTVLALAMPAYTLYILFAPALNALGHARVTMLAALFGAVIMTVAFVTGLQWGIVGLAYAWLAAFPLVLLTTFALAKDKLGLDLRQLASAVAPGLLASALMGSAVFLLRGELSAWASWLRLPLEVAAGAGIYLALLYFFARPTLFEAAGLVIRRTPPAATAAA